MDKIKEVSLFNHHKINSHLLRASSIQTTSYPFIQQIFIELFWKGHYFTTVTGLPLLQSAVFYWGADSGEQNKYMNKMNLDSDKYHEAKKASEITVLHSDAVFREGSP